MESITNSQMFSYSECIQGLDKFYGQIKRQILRYQSPTTGLFPSMSNDQYKAVIRDSIYCAVAIWSLYQAYVRRIDDNLGKAYELGQSAAKCMRGILYSWMRHSKTKIEPFKANQSIKHALPSKVNLITSLPLNNDSENNNLQLDVVSLYLLFLVQMINSGLQLIYTMDEVQFIQNLVYYVERSYRTPDYGMWAQDSSINQNLLEIHASSIGMAKSALESINGCNLFGEKGASWSVIHVDIDAHSRNRSTFETLLPRESNSKNTDASLLPTIGWPCFATHDSILYNQTRERVLNNLKTPFGLKRFLRDGYGVYSEQNTINYYNNETKNFNNVECTWPVFYCFLIIEAIFKNDERSVNEFKDILFNNLLKTEPNYGDYIIPRYFYVPPESANFKNLNQKSILRHPENKCDSLYLLGQSVLIIAQLLLGHYLDINELDPIRRYTPSYERYKKVGRHSIFQGTAADNVVQVVLLAESIRLKAMMATYGIQTQTPVEVEPVQIWSSSELIKIYEYLGSNKKLGLKGRPPRPIGSLGTSKLYRIFGNTILCYPLIFENSDFYLSNDLALLIDDIKNELNFVGKYWRMKGRPTVCIMLKEENLRDVNFKEMLNLLVEFKLGCLKSTGLKIKIGRIQNLISSSCIEHLDFLDRISNKCLPKFKSFQQLKHLHDLGFQSLINVEKFDKYNESIEIDYEIFEDKATSAIIEALKSCNTLYGQSQLLWILMKREGLQFVIPFGGTVENHIQIVSQKACALRYWAVVRFCSSILKKLVDSISPSITSILVNQKQLTVGSKFQESLIDCPRTPNEVHHLIYSTNHNVYDSVLQQEIIIYIGHLISTSPQLFDGIFRLRIGSELMQAMRFYLISKNSRDSKNCQIESLSPTDLRRVIFQVFTDTDLSPLQKRHIDGSLGRFPKDFYDKVWDILQRTPGGISVGNHKLSSSFIVSQMSSQDLNYKMEVENFIFTIVAPEYRQILVELLIVIFEIFRRNPELVIKHNQPLDLDDLVRQALLHYNSSLSPEKAILQFYQKSKSEIAAHFARSVLDKLLQFPQIECHVS